MENLQTQTLKGDRVRDQGRVFQDMIHRAIHQLEGFPMSLRPVPTCAVREEHEEDRSPGHGDTAPGPHIGLSCPRPSFLLHSLTQEDLSMQMESIH